MKYVISAVNGVIDDDIKAKLRSTKKDAKGRPLSTFYHKEPKRVRPNSVEITVDKEVKALEDLIESGDGRVSKVA